VRSYTVLIGDNIQAVIKNDSFFTREIEIEFKLCHDTLNKKLRKLKIHSFIGFFIISNQSKSKV
jgi:hypothetical protein